GVDVSRRRRWNVEELREDPLGSRRRRRSALAAVLDHGADDDLRVVRRTIAAPPRLVPRTGVTREADGLLRRPGLAGDWLREVAEHAVRGAEGVVRRLEEALLDDAEVGRIEPRYRLRRGRRGRRHDRPVRVLDVHQ